MFQIQTAQSVYTVGSRNLTHYLDGYTKMARIHFLNGEATFRTRLLTTDSFKASIAMGDVSPCITLGETSPPFKGLDKLAAITKSGDNGYYNVFPFGEDTAVTNDVAKVYSIDQRTLETIDSFTPQVPGLETMYLSTTHPILEFNTSNTLTFAISLLPVPAPFKWLSKATIIVYRAKSFVDRDVVVEIPIDTDHVPMMHSFAASANYVILFAHPEYVDFFTAMETTFVLPALKFQPEDMTTLYVVALKTSKVLKFHIAPWYFVHHVNSYEEGNEIIVDYVIYDRGSGPGFMQLYEMLSLPNLRNRTKRNSVDVHMKLMRITMDLVTGNVTTKRHTPIPGLHNDLDFPVINEAYRHRKACQVYGVVIKADGKNFATNALVKKNVCDAGKDKVWFKRNQYINEPNFIARPGAVTEDDGILIATVMDGDKGETYVGVFDAVTMTLIDKAYTPDAISMSTHGHFFKDE